MPSLKDECTKYLRETRLSHNVDPSGKRWLLIPGHKPLPAHDPSKVRSHGVSHKAEFYEQSTTLLLSFLLNRFKPHTFLDIGSADGYFARVAASNTTAAPVAHAFDMRPETVAQLQRASAGLDLPGKVVGHLAGLSDTHAGNRDIWFARTKMFEYEPKPQEYQEAWYRRLKFFLRGNRSRGLHKASVLLTSIDHFCESSNAAPGLIKCDVDGYEGQVLKGAQHRMSAADKPLILLELHRDRMQRGGYTRRTVARQVFDAGYKALFLTDHHEATKCDFIPAGPDHELFNRQETDMVLFVPEAKWEA